MLQDFLEIHRDELTARCRDKATARNRRAQPVDRTAGISALLGQLVETLRTEGIAAVSIPGSKSEQDIMRSAGLHGNDLLRKGFTIDQVVHDYGDLCQAVTELAGEKRVEIAVDEFRTFNRCLDNAIAQAVVEFGAARDRVISHDSQHTLTERLGSLAHELRNHLGTALLAFHAMKTGGVALTGATGAVLDRSLDNLRKLLDRSLADVRLTTGLHSRLESILISEFIDEVEVAARLDAADRGLEFSVAIEPGLRVEGDRQMLFSAVSNLLRNAFKFTRDKSHVHLRAHAVDKRILIEIEDECGGLPAGETEELFQPFEQRGRDRTGVGLGLAISRRAVETNGGTLTVVDLPGKGCVFTIDLPRPPA